MAKPAKQIADPIHFLTVHPFCAYPHMKTLIEGLPLDPQQKKKLLVEVHRFEHALLSEGHKLYADVGKELGALVLDAALRTFAEEYLKWAPIRRE